MYLRWGTTFWKPSDPEFKEEAFQDLWGGWGYRHIVSKHGWSALDLEETEEALFLDKSPEKTTKASKWIYETPVNAKGEGGAKCARRVVVDFEADEKLEDPAPRGIVTSFNLVE